MEFVSDEKGSLLSDFVHGVPHLRCECREPMLEGVRPVRCHKRLAGYDVAGCLAHPAWPVMGLAEGAGFEPASRNGLPGFEPGSMDHSDTPRLNSFRFALDRCRRFRLSPILRRALRPDVDRLVGVFVSSNLNLTRVYEPLEDSLNRGEGILVLMDRKIHVHQSVAHVAHGSRFQPLLQGFTNRLSQTHIDPDWAFEKLRILVFELQMGKSVPLGKADLWAKPYR